MTFFEREVLSIPAGATYELVMQHRIYSCSNKSGYQHKKTLFLTFRRGNGGEMEALYKISKLLCFDPNVEGQTDRELADPDLSEREKSRIRDYMAAHPWWAEPSEAAAAAEGVRFYVLGEPIELRNKPRPKRNNVGFWYYDIAELLNCPHGGALPDRK